MAVAVSGRTVRLRHRDERMKTFETHYNVVLLYPNRFTRTSRVCTNNNERQNGAMTFILTREHCGSSG